MKRLFLLLLLLACAGSLFAVDGDLAEVRIIYSGRMAESMAVVYPEKLSSSQQMNDIAYVKSCIMSFDVAVTTGSVRKNGTECTTICYIIHRYPVRPGNGSLLDIVITLLKRYRHINVECYGLPAPSRSYYTVNNKYVDIRGEYYGDLLEYDVIVRDPGFSRLRTPDIYVTEKRFTIGIFLIIIGVMGAFCIFAVTRKR
ncbi:MAG: hypothetical protein IK083_00860 [Abditibacteriota bacterium]|nr:hypothetical protein [Abditibacteriota bacterium]